MEVQHHRVALAAYAAPALGFVLRDELAVLRAQAALPVASFGFLGSVPVRLILATLVGVFVGHQPNSPICGVSSSSSAPRQRWQRPSTSTTIEPAVRLGVGGAFGSERSHVFPLSGRRTHSPSGARQAWQTMAGMLRFACGLINRT